MPTIPRCWRRMAKPCSRICSSVIACGFMAILPPRATPMDSPRGPALRCVACGDAEHAIIGGEKDVDCRLLGAGKMEGIIGAKAHRLQFLCTRDSNSRQRDRARRSAEHIPDTRPSLGTWRIVDLFLDNGTTEPLPYPSLATPQDQE